MALDAGSDGISELRRRESPFTVEGLIFFPRTQQGLDFLAFCD